MKANSKFPPKEPMIYWQAPAHTKVATLLNPTWH